VNRLLADEILIRFTEGSFSIGESTPSASRRLCFLRLGLFISSNVQLLINVNNWIRIIFQHKNLYKLYDLDLRQGFYFDVKELDQKVKNRRRIFYKFSLPASFLNSASDCGSISSGVVDLCGNLIFFCRFSSPSQKATRLHCDRPPREVHGRTVF